VTRRWSLAGRLTSSLILGLAALWFAAAVASMLVARHELNEAFDGALQETAQRLLPLAIHDLRERGEGREVEHDEIEEHDEYLVYQLRDATGRILLRSHDAPSEPFPMALRRGFAEAGGWRSYTEAGVRGRLFFQVAEPLEHRDEVLGEILLWLTAPLGLLVPLAGLIVVMVVRRGLAPMAAVREAIRERGSTDLNPIPYSGLPAELAPIVDDVNRLMARLSKALESERSFAANSAHELRTPVAAALAQLSRLSVELRGTPAADRVDRIGAVLRDLGRTVEKLLQLSRAEAGIALRRDPVDLVQVADLLVEEFQRSTVHGDRLRLLVETDADMIVRGDVDVLGIALRNLIENALVHGPADAPVDVVVAADGAIHVINDGPVVPADHLGTLTGRFERGAARASGSGLGLAIVDTIARQMGGSLRLLSPAGGRASGFEAVLRLPLDR